jgi:hypothetical protein
MASKGKQTSNVSSYAFQLQGCCIDFNRGHHIHTAYLV